jgi:hypothetical protein
MMLRELFLDLDIDNIDRLVGVEAGLKVFGTDIVICAVASQ